MGDLIFNAFESRGQKKFVSYDITTRKRTTKENAARTFAKTLRNLVEISEDQAKRTADEFSSFDSFENANYKLLAMIVKLIREIGRQNITPELFRPESKQLDKDYIPKILPEGKKVSDLSEVERSKIYALFFRYYGWYVKCKTDYENRFKIGPK